MGFDEGSCRVAEGATKDLSGIVRILVACRRRADRSEGRPRLLGQQVGHRSRVGAAARPQAPPMITTRTCKMPNPRRYDRPMLRQLLLPISHTSLKVTHLIRQ
jgi:hypothetical protein